MISLLYHPSVQTAIWWLPHIPDLIQATVSLRHSNPQRRHSAGPLDTMLHHKHAPRHSTSHITWLSFLHHNQHPSVPTVTSTLSPNPFLFLPGLNEVVEMHFPWRSLSWRSAHNRTFNPRISHSIPEFLIKHRMVRGNDMESKESSDLNQCHSYASSSNR